MKMRNVVRMGLLVTLVAFAEPAVPAAGVQDAPVRTDSVQDQFAITLPDGWSVGISDGSVNEERTRPISSNVQVKDSSRAGGLSETSWSLATA